MANDPTKPSQDNVSVEGTKTIPTKLINLISAVRSRLRDFPELNRLVLGQETSDRQIAFAIAESVDDFNQTPPQFKTYGYADHPSRTLLIDGAIIKILESIIHLQTRNHLVYSDGQGVQAGISDKSPALMGMLQYMQSVYEQKKNRLKVSININRALNLSHVGSEYAVIDGYFDHE